MRIIVRTIVILLAAGLVVAATLALGGSSADAGRSQPSGIARERAAPPDGAFAEGRGRGERGGGLFAAGELLKSLAIIAVIVAVVAPLSRWLGNRRRQLRA